MPHPPLCPSAPLRPRSKLIGVVTGRGEVAFLGEARRVDDGFIEEARKGRDPERRFRFASPCCRSGCANWSGGGCSLPERVLSELDSALPESLPLPKCGIRASCVWYAQSGPRACGGCRFTVTQVGPPDDVGPQQPV